MTVFCTSCKQGHICASLLCSDHTDWGSVTTEDATQNAALAGLLFLAGGVGKDSPHFIITLVGSDPTVRPTALGAKQASSMLDQRLKLLHQQKVRCSHCNNVHRDTVHDALAHSLFVLDQVCCFASQQAQVL